jgi:hypothetical protein
MTDFSCLRGAFGRGTEDIVTPTILRLLPSAVLKKFTETLDSSNDTHDVVVTALMEVAVGRFAAARNTISTHLGSRQTYYIHACVSMLAACELELGDSKAAHACIDRYLADVHPGSARLHHACVFIAEGQVADAKRAIGSAADPVAAFLWGLAKAAEGDRVRAHAFFSEAGATASISLFRRTARNFEFAVGTTRDPAHDLWSADRKVPGEREIANRGHTGRVIGELVKTTAAMVADLQRDYQAWYATLPVYQRDELADLDDLAEEHQDYHAGDTDDDDDASSSVEVYTDEDDDEDDEDDDDDDDAFLVIDKIDVGALRVAWTPRPPCHTVGCKSIAHLDVYGLQSLVDRFARTTRSATFRVTKNIGAAWEAWVEKTHYDGKAEPHPVAAKRAFQIGAKSSAVFQAYLS